MLKLKYTSSNETFFSYEENYVFIFYFSQTSVQLSFEFITADLGNNL